MSGDMGFLLMVAGGLGALSWLFFDSFTLGVVAGFLLWLFVGRK